jgi:hypothetical protein
MTRYLISFPSGVMDFPEEEGPEVARAAHAVIQEAKDAGVYLFTGGLDEDVEPVMVAGDGTVTAGTYPQTKEASPSSTCPHGRLPSSGPQRSRPPAAVRKRSGSSCSTRSSDRSAPWLTRPCLGRLHNHSALIGNAGRLLRPERRRRGVAQVAEAM